MKSLKCYLFLKKSCVCKKAKGLWAGTFHRGLTPGADEASRHEINRELHGSAGGGTLGIGKTDRRGPRPPRSPRAGDASLDLRGAPRTPVSPQPFPIPACRRHVRCASASPVKSPTFCPDCFEVTRPSAERPDVSPPRPPSRRSGPSPPDFRGRPNFPRAARNWVRTRRRFSQHRATSAE
jgi:hypothetical protein